MKLLLTMITFLMLSSCASSQENKSKCKIIEIEFTNIVEGYTVKAYWLPKEVKYDYIVGPAIVEFNNTSDSSSFTITNDYFCILGSRLPVNYNTDTTEIISFKEDKLKLIYQMDSLVKRENFGTTTEPFYFDDIDFDNNKELIICEFGIGQRGVASFNVYPVGNVTQMTDFGKEPFVSLDEMSKVDHINKRIIIYGSGGICYGSYKIYVPPIVRNDNGESKFILETIIEEQRDDNLNKCYELKYKVVNGIKKLISKREIK